ncbi:hypothetical protein BV25DRAFT_1026038 [Artomyces pyxidatus]|uniref:Uncharacterized protein n=1 Tax=Artomyces pyxidatus TaxID=48021 RepID=A0ACB8ST70_9AGAM|nr:hypothetical protein BV25DRAFT_1026038 [Artomyces pyxidatus]
MHTFDGAPEVLLTSRRTVDVSVRSLFLPSYGRPFNIIICANHPRRLFPVSGLLKLKRAPSLCLSIRTSIVLGPKQKGYLRLCDGRASPRQVISKRSLKPSCTSWVCSRQQYTLVSTPNIHHLPFLLRAPSMRRDRVAVQIHPSRNPQLAQP